MTKVSEDGRRELGEKIDKIGEKLEAVNERLDKLEAKNVDYDHKFREFEEKCATYEEKIAAIQTKATADALAFGARVTELEGQLQRYKEEEDIEMGSLRELIESRTNRQLRKTVIFKNIPETKADETYAEVKTLLARAISENTSLSYETAYASIDRAHRESKTVTGREGKKLIYAAFLNWEISQQVIVELRQGCISKRTNIAADQMYGPMTSRRRNLAFQKRKELKDLGVITSGYVDFPARLMVNIPGDFKPNGKKHYKLHTNFSSHDV